MRQLTIVVERKYFLYTTSIRISQLSSMNFKSSKMKPIFFQKSLSFLKISAQGIVSYTST